MPEAFDRCVKGGGRVRTVSGPNKSMGLQAGQFTKICFPRGGGKPVRGETKRKATEKDLREDGK